MESTGLPLYPTNTSQAMLQHSSHQKSQQQYQGPQMQQPTSPMPLQHSSHQKSQQQYQGPQMQQPTSPMPVQQLLGPTNTVTTCRFCSASIKTAVKYTVTARTHMAAALCALLCCCCCIAYGSDSAKNSDHYCPNCQKYLGTYEK